MINKILCVKFPGNVRLILDYLDQHAGLLILASKTLDHHDKNLMLLPSVYRINIERRKEVYLLGGRRKLTRVAVPLRRGLACGNIQRSYKCYCSALWHKKAYFCASLLNGHRTHVGFLISRLPLCMKKPT